MFSLSQPHAGEQPPTYMDVPIVHMTESTGTLESLLRYCYPIPDPEFASIDDLKPVLEAARKYQMDYAMRMLAQRLLVLAEAAPLQAYAVALQLDLDNIAQAAAKLTLRYEYPCAFTKELEYISAAAYHRLAVYRRTCAVVLRSETLNKLTWLGSEGSSNFIWFVRIGGSARGDCPCTVSTEKGFRFGPRPSPAHPIYHALSWFVRHLDRVATELSAKPCSQTVENASISDQMVEEASACTRCRQHVLAQSRQFHTQLAKEVEKVISGVTLEIVRN